MAKKYFLGIDVGGTKTVVGKISVGGDILETKKMPTPKESGLDFLLKIAQKYQSTDLWGIGIGMAGLVDFDREKFVDGPNLPDRWNDQSPTRIIGRKLDVPVVLDNDAHCFALGEARYGLGKKYQSLLGITLGTGIGGGIVINNEVYRGKDNGAGEIGHITIDRRSGAICGCGRKGHLEALAAGQSLVKRYRKISGKQQTAREISAAAKQGDKAAKKAIAQTAQALGIGLASLAHTLNPEVIVIGGGLAKTTGLVKTARQFFKEHASVFEPLKETPIIRSKLSVRANLLGAAALAMDERASRNL